MASKGQEDTKGRLAWLVYQAKRDQQVLQVPRVVEDHQGHQGQKDLKEGKVTEGCKELLDLQAHQVKLEAQVIQDLLVHLVSMELLA